MAVNKSTRIIFSAIILIIALGTVLIFSGRTSKQTVSTDEIDKFISIFIDLSIAKETYDFDPDSVNKNFSDIYDSAGVDSTWMANFALRISGDPEKQNEIWGKLVDILDSLRVNAPPDTVKQIQSKSAVNADSM